MKLLDGVRTYVEGKRSGGADYAGGTRSLASFCRHAGNIDLSSISERQVASFLDGPQTSPITWRHKYNSLRNFFLFWVARSAMPALPMPPARPPVAQTFVPYIYSRAEIVFSYPRFDRLKRRIVARSIHALFVRSCCFSTERERWSARLAGCYVRMWILKED